MSNQKDTRDIIYKDDLQSANDIKEGDLEDQDFISKGEDGKSLLSKLRYWVKKMKQHPESRKFTQYFLIGLFFLIANASYLATTVKCPFPSDHECGKYYRPIMPLWIALLVEAAFFFTTIIFFGIYYGFGSRKLGVLGLLNVLYLSYLHNNSLEHGVYGRELGHVLWIFTLIILSVFHIFWLIHFCFKKNKLLTIMLVPLSIYIFCTVFVARSCVGWTKGLAGEEIDQNIGCQITVPQSCIYDMHGTWMDFSWWLDYDCKNEAVHSEVMKTYYPSAPFIGFSRTEGLPQMYRNSFNLSKAVQDNLVPLQSMEDEKAKDLEIFLETGGFKNPKLHINVKRNETLVTERAKLLKGPGLTKNLLLVFIDTVSRAHSRVNYKKTLEWVESFMNQKTARREAFQFFKFHSITPYTPGNVFAMLYNKEFPASPIPPEKPNYSMYKTFKESGYIVGHAVTICDVSHLNIKQVRNLLPYLTEVPPDHEGVSFPCDPTYDQNGTSDFQGHSSYGRRCLYKRDVHEYTLEYGAKFWKAYPNENKILHLDFIDNHEGTTNVGRYLDEHLLHFFTDLDRQHLLDDTSIVFLSDHGLHLAFDWQKAHDAYAIEKSLPFLYFMVPKNVAQKHRLQIKENQQKLISMFQVHHFLWTFMEGENSEHLNKSIMGDLPWNLTCNDFKLYDTLCYCNYK